MTREGFEWLPGTPLRPGMITIPSAERLDLAKVLRSPPPARGLHPLHAYIAMQRGIGESIADLCRYADFRIEDGPMMGSLDLEVHADLDPDVEYRVEGELLGIERKQGSRFAFDLLTYQERLLDQDHHEVARTTNTFVLPRVGEDSR